MRLAADGKLPELRLEESASQKPETKSKSVNPLVMFGALSMSIVLSVVLVLMRLGPSTASRAQQKAAMRQKIEDNYFGSEMSRTRTWSLPEAAPRRPAGLHPRRPSDGTPEIIARCWTCSATERGSHEKGLTGSRTRDKELEEAISVLLSEG